MNKFTFVFVIIALFGSINVELVTGQNCVNGYVIQTTDYPVPYANSFSTCTPSGSSYCFAVTPVYPYIEGSTQMFVFGCSNVPMTVTLNGNATAGSASLNISCSNSSQTGNGTAQVGNETVSYIYECYSSSVCLAEDWLRTRDQFVNAIDEKLAYCNNTSGCYIGQTQSLESISTFNSTNEFGSLGCIGATSNLTDGKNSMNFQVTSCPTSTQNFTLSGETYTYMLTCFNNAGSTNSLESWLSVALLYSIISIVYF
jgi:hypothetical protein